MRSDFGLHFQKRVLYLQIIFENGSTIVNYTIQYSKSTCYVGIKNKQNRS